MIPLTKNTTLADRFTQTIFTANNRAAPIANSLFPAPSIIPKVAVGGNSATATITPTNTLESPVVRETTAAAPEAKAKAIESNPTFVLAMSSGLSKLIG